MTSSSSSVSTVPAATTCSRPATPTPPRSRLELDGGADNDDFTVFDAPYNPMTVTGGPGTDVMRYTASQGTDIITIAADRVTTSAQGGPPVVHPFSGIETMTVGGFTLGDTFNVIPLPATASRSTAGRTSTVSTRSTSTPRARW